MLVNNTIGFFFVECDHVLLVLKTMEEVIVINSNSSESDEDTNVDDNHDNEFGCVAATSSRKVKCFGVSHPSVIYAIWLHSF